MKAVPKTVRPPSSAGDTLCDDSEDYESCPQDCEAPLSCGDGLCDDSEFFETCPADCAPDLVCEDGQSLVIIEMTDSYGDGWFDNILTIGDEEFGLLAAPFGAAATCLELSSCIPVTCEGEIWPEEVSWTISVAEDILLAGGSPFAGSLGACQTTKGSMSSD